MIDEKKAIIKAIMDINRKIDTEYRRVKLKSLQSKEIDELNSIYNDVRNTLKELKGDLFG